MTPAAASALAIALGVFGATALYLGAPWQRLLRQRWPAVASLGLGCVGLATSLALFAAQLNVAVAIYSWLTLLMICFSVLPFLAAYLRRSETKA